MTDKDLNTEQKDEIVKEVITQGRNRTREEDNHSVRQDRRQGR